MGEGEGCTPKYLSTSPETFGTPLKNCQLPKQTVLRVVPPDMFPPPSSNENKKLRPCQGLFKEHLKPRNGNLKKVVKPPVGEYVMGVFNRIYQILTREKAHTCFWIKR